MQISRDLRRMLSFVANIPRAVLGTRMNSDACRIRAGTGKFDLSTDTCGNGNFFFADFKNIWIKKYALFIPLKRALSETTSRTQDQEFLLSFFPIGE